jgi:KDEL-tailed cysteine endopeptidase
VWNQGQCGSSPHFAAAGAIEGAFEIAGHPLTALSPQDLVSCEVPEHGGQDQGCNGGLMDNMFTWVKAHGISTNASYPYTSGTGVTGTCHRNRQPVVTIGGFTDVANEGGMPAALMINPLASAVAVSNNFQMYSKGVFDDPQCGTQASHGILVTGFGTDTASGKDYWRLRNQWGTDWGEAGYIRIVRGKNMCAVGTYNSYPTGAKAWGPGPHPGPSHGPAPHPSPAPAPAPAPGPQPHTCAVIGCDGGYDPSRPCQCDGNCESYQNCCTDYEEECVDTYKCVDNKCVVHQGSGVPMEECVKACGKFQ